MLFTDRARTLDGFDKFGGKFEFKVVFWIFALDEIQILRHTLVINNSADRRLDDARDKELARYFVLGDEHSAAEAVVCSDSVAVKRLFVGKRKMIEFPFGKFHGTAHIHFVLTMRIFELIAHERLVEGSKYGRFVNLAVLIQSPFGIVTLALFPS